MVIFTRGYVMRCVECGSIMQETRAPITELIRGVSVTVEGIEHYHCECCGNITMSIEAAEELAKKQMEEVSHAKGILAPSQIKAIRKKLGLTQKELEELIGVSSPTVSRWETGAMLPSKTADTLIRLLGEFPDAVAYLRKKPAGGAFTVNARRGRERRISYMQGRATLSKQIKEGIAA